MGILKPSGWDSSGSLQGGAGPSLPPKGAAAPQGVFRQNQ